MIAGVNKKILKPGSGRTSPAIELMGKIHNGIEFSTPGAT
jgi:hypothetical protein